MTTKVQQATNEISTGLVNSEKKFVDGYAKVKFVDSKSFQIDVFLEDDRSEMNYVTLFLSREKRNQYVLTMDYAITKEEGCEFITVCNLVFKSKKNIAGTFNDFMELGQRLNTWLKDDIDNAPDWIRAVIDCNYSERDYFVF